MVSRIAILIGSIVASAVLAVALASAGFGPSSTPSPAPTAAATEALTQAADAAPTPQATTQVDTVYVKPAPTPKTIRIVRAAPTRPPVVVQQTRPAAANQGGDGESDGAND